MTEVESKQQAKETSKTSKNIELSENALAVLKKRYLKKDAAGSPTEEPIDMFERVAAAIAEAEFVFAGYAKLDRQKAEDLFVTAREKFLELMISRRFMPNSPTLMNAGRDLGQLSACFVLPVEDSIESIYETLKNQALIHKSGGGTGFAFSKLRPKNDLVRSTMGVSSGPVSFMSVYDASTEHIKQGGTRRGANMGILRVDHPDIEEFIDCKKDNDRINNFNISVAITDEFMDAVKDGTDFDLTNPHSNEVSSSVDARSLFTKIVEGAWLNGEPGVVFIDRINDDNPTPQFPIEATNPCSEAHLPAYDSCNLGSINLERFVLSAKEAEQKIADLASSEEKLPHTLRTARSKPTVDWVALKQTVKDAIHFLDNVIEINNYPLPQIETMSRGNRRIGLGVMGFADLLIKLNVPYDSERALDLADSIMEWIDRHAWEASRELATKRGVMPHFDGSRHQADGKDVRNATVTTIAPTGTISMIAGCSGGIEPIFAVAFMRRQADMELPDVNPAFVEASKNEGFYSEDLMKTVATNGSVQEMSEVPNEIREIFRTAGDISPEFHVRMQAAFQKHTSMGISKTINMPASSTKEDVRNAYLQAYETGCKGIAVYRDGSRDAQVLSTGKTTHNGTSDRAIPRNVSDFPNLSSLSDTEKERLQDIMDKQNRSFAEDFVLTAYLKNKDVEELLVGLNPDELEEHRTWLSKQISDQEPKPSRKTLAEARNGRPNTLTGITKKLKTGHGPLYVTMNDDEFGPRECFILLGKPGGTASAFSDALGRMISLAMTHGATPYQIHHQLRGIQDGHPAGFGLNAVLSVPDGVAKALAEHYLSAISETEAGQTQLPIIAPCPDCGSSLVQESACEVCHSCGYSRCS